MKISCEEFRIGPRSEAKLAQRPATTGPCYESKTQYRKIVKEHVERLSARRRLHDA